MVDIVHDQDLVIGEARLAVDVGLTNQLAASLVLPVRLVSTSIRYLDAAGSEVALVNENIHHRNETLTGIGDPMLLAAFSNLVAGDVRLTLRGGVTVPLGRTEPDPFRLGALGMSHQHVQMGTDTVNPVLGVDVTRAWGKWQLGGFVFTQQVLYENDNGHKAGDRYAGGIALRHRVAKSWNVRGGAEVQGETAERWRGISHSDDGNRGRIDAMLVAGASFAAADRLAIDLAVKVPFVTHVVGGQLEMPAIVELGVSWSFGARPPPVREDDHDHEHEHGDHDHEHGDDHARGDEHAHADDPAHGDDHAHGDEHAHDAHADGHEHTDNTAVAVRPRAGQPHAGQPHDGQPSSGQPHAGQSHAGQPHAGQPHAGQPHAGQPHAGQPTRGQPTKSAPAKLDIADLGKPGEARDLVPVRGKLTIFDFWATWCQPCKTLEPALVALVRTYPDAVALRRIDVVDWDSKTAERYLTPGRFDLPHLKIYDASGKLVLEKSSAPGKLQALIDETRVLAAKAAAARPKPARFAIGVTDAGFVPANIDVPRDTPVTLVFTRRATNTCATEVILEVDGKRLERSLPLDQPVELALTFTKPGVVNYACAMKHFRGTLTVR